MIHTDTAAAVFLFSHPPATPIYTYPYPVAIRGPRVLAPQRNLAIVDATAGCLKNHLAMAIATRLEKAAEIGAPLF
ncbi:hypothetical protein NT01EI_2341 [Edwardsiella ictaluri 93-146]|uniref:Uncharacterized protein n=1 Tax=Edwardsiella ictaluri (strain 93-146) TaxID=634503 RepID=C5B8E2_EDWI9|nr:hypothetical protein NT01EI_2341 [Edwardsiella ictaluri 93-146]